MESKNQIRQMVNFILQEAHEKVGFWSSRGCAAWGLLLVLSETLAFSHDRHGDLLVVGERDPDQDGARLQH